MKTAPNAWPPGEIDFLQFARLRTNESLLFVLAMTNSMLLDKDSMPAKRFTPFTMTYRWKRKRPIPSNTRTVTINPAQTMTNSRLRTAMTNIQSPLLDRAGAAEYRRSSS